MFSSLLTQYRLTRMKEMTSSAIIEATTNVRGDIDDQKREILDYISTKNTINSDGLSPLVEKPSQDLVKAIELLRQHLDKYNSDNKEALENINVKMESFEILMASLYDDNSQIELKNNFEDLNRKLCEMNETTKLSLDKFQANISRQLKYNLNNIKETGHSDIIESKEMTQEDKMPTDYLTVQNLNVVLTLATLGLLLSNTFSIS